MKLYPILFLIGVAGAFACNSVSSGESSLSGGDSLLSFVVSDPDRALRVEELFDSVELIQLETTPRSLVGDIRQMQVLADRFYLLDAGGTALYAFTNEGKFVDKLSMQGRGPNEYLMLHWFYADRASGKIVAADGLQRKIFIYDPDLNLERVIRTDFVPGCPVALQGDEVLHFKPWEKEMEEEPFMRGYDLQAIGPDGTLLRGLVGNEVPDCRLFSNMAAFADDGALLFLPPMGDTLYRVCSGGVSPIGVITSEEKRFRMLSQKQKRAFVTEQAEELDGQGYLLSSEFYFTGRFLTVGFGERTLRYLRSMRTGRSVAYDPKQIGGDPSMRYLTERIMACDEEWFYHPYNVFILQTAARIEGISGIYIDRIGALDPDANPVIVRFRPKEFR